MTSHQAPSPLNTDTDVLLPASAYLRHANRADGWSGGRQAAFLTHLADNGVVADAARSIGMSLGGGYALRRQARGFAFSLGWEAALILARRIVADNLMAAAVQGETSRWVREDGVTTFTRANSKLSLSLLDRIDPTRALPEVQAVATQFDWYMQLINDGVSAEDLWSLFFDESLPRSDIDTRERVRACLLLSEISDDSDDEDDEDEYGYGTDIEYKSMDGPASLNGSDTGKGRRGGIATSAKPDHLLPFAHRAARAFSPPHASACQIRGIPPKGSKFIVRQWGGQNVS